MLKKDLSESYSCVFVRDIEVDVKIGIYEAEAAAQRVRVSIALYTASSYVSVVTEGTILDYKILHDAVLEWPGRPHVRLIESYIRELADLSFSFAEVRAAKISVTKADIFPAAKGGAGVEVFLTREEYKKL